MFTGEKSKHKKELIWVVLGHFQIRIFYGTVKFIMKKMGAVWVELLKNDVFEQFLSLQSWD